MLNVLVVGQFTHIDDDALSFLADLRSDNFVSVGLYNDPEETVFDRRQALFATGLVGEVYRCDPKDTGWLVDYTESAQTITYRGD